MRDRAIAQYREILRNDFSAYIMWAFLQIGWLRGTAFGLFLYFAFPRQGCDKVWLPGFASITRKRLFEMMRVRCDIRPDHSDQDRATIECLLIEKLSAPILELTNHRWVQDTDTTVGKILCPLMRLRIVKKQGQPLTMARRTIRLDLLHLCVATPKFADRNRAIKFHPVVRAGERMQQAADMRFPGTDIEIEIVLPVPRYSGGRGRIRTGISLPR